MRTREEYGKLLDGYSHRNLSNAEAITAGLLYLLAQTNLLLDIRDQNERIIELLSQDHSHETRMLATGEIVNVVKRMRHES